MSCEFDTPRGEEDDNICRTCGIDLDEEYVTYEGDLCPECYWVCEDEGEEETCFLFDLVQDGNYFEDEDEEGE